MNLKQFKQYMKDNVGREFSCIKIAKVNSEWTEVWKPPIRKLAQVNTVGFALESSRTEGGLSYCDWPKAKQLITICDHLLGMDQPRIKIDIWGDGSEFLIYELVRGE